MRTYCFQSFVDDNDSRSVDVDDDSNFDNVNVDQDKSPTNNNFDDDDNGNSCLVVGVATKRAICNVGGTLVLDRTFSHIQLAECILENSSSSYLAQKGQKEAIDQAYGTA